MDYRLGYPAYNKLSLCYPLSLPSSAQVKEILGTEWFPFPQKSQCWLITMEQRLSQCWDAYEKPNPERNGCSLTANRARSILQHSHGRWDLHIQSAKVCKNNSSKLRSVVHTLIKPPHADPKRIFLNVRPLTWRISTLAYPSVCLPLRVGVAVPVWTFWGFESSIVQSDNPIKDIGRA